MHLPRSFRARERWRGLIARCADRSLRGIRHVAEDPGAPSRGFVMDFCDVAPDSQSPCRSSRPPLQDRLRTSADNTQIVQRNHVIGLQGECLQIARPLASSKCPQRIERHATMHVRVRRSRIGLHRPEPAALQLRDSFVSPCSNRPSWYRRVEMIRRRALEAAGMLPLRPAGVRTFCSGQTLVRHSSAATRLLIFS